MFIGYSCDKEEEKQEQPSNPILIYPSELAIDVNLEVNLQWESSFDQNGDNIEYSVYYNTEPHNWIMAGKTASTSFHLSLESNTTYYWYVSASDGYTPSVDSKNRVFKTLNTNTPPIASFSISQEIGWLETQFVFDASECTDDQSPTTDLEVRWDFEDDGNWDTNWSTDKTVTHVYSEVGNYTIKMEVRDTEDEIVDIEKQVKVNLFDPAVYSSIPSSYFHNVFIEDFNDNSNNWSIADDDVKRAIIQNGYYEIACLSEDKSHLFWREISNLSEDWDFQIEAKIKITEASQSNSNWSKSCGVFWGHHKVSSGKHNYFHFRTTSDKKYVLQNEIDSNDVYEYWSDYFTSSDNVYGINAFNTLTIRKFDGQYYFFINEEKVLEHQFENFHGENIGLVTGYNTTCQIDYLKVHKISNTKSANLQTSSNKTGECGIQINE